MPLTPQEELELLELEEQEYLHSQQQPSAATPEEQKVKETLTALEGLKEGALQGSTLGFSDEIVGRIDQAIHGITRLVGNDPDSAMSLSEIYERGRDDARAKIQRAKTEQPLAFGAGELGSAFATPGIGALKAASAGARIGKAAATSGAQRVGTAENIDSLSEAKSQFAKGALTGAAFGGAGQAAGKLARAVPKGAEKLGKTVAKLPPVLEQLKKGVSSTANVGIALAGAPTIPLARIMGGVAFKQIAPRLGLVTLEKLNKIATNNPKKLEALRQVVEEGQGSKAMTQIINDLTANKDEN